MTLREKNHEPSSSLQRKYSVSQSGKYKSRPKIRPSLGDVFRPEVSGAGGSENQYGAVSSTLGNVSALYWVAETFHSTVAARGFLIVD